MSLSIAISLISEATHKSRAAELGGCPGDFPSAFIAEQQPDEATRNRARRKAGLAVEQLTKIESRAARAFCFGRTSTLPCVQELIEKRLGLIDHYGVLRKTVSTLTWEGFLQVQDAGAQR